MSQLTRSAASERSALPALLAGTLQRLATGGDRALLRRTVELLCREREQGHVCISLADWAGSHPDEPGPDEPVAFPDRAAWRADLRASGLCGDGTGPATPLVLDAGDRLYLRRHWAAEQRLVAFVQERLARPVAGDAAGLARTLRELGLIASAGEPDWQLAAIVAAVRCSLMVLTGGPGTGKTTTVARILGVLLHQQPDLRVALCAPTGKAATRLGEALRQRAAHDQHLAALADRLAPRTLHSLLGYLPLEDAFRAGRHRPLPYDVVIVDEASMVDPAILAELVGALRGDARLLLVGDRDQLASVAAGQVLGDLCRVAAPERGPGPRLARQLAAAAGMQVPSQPEAAALADVVVTLRTNHRFGAQPGIGAFALALARREPAAALAALHAGHADLTHTDDAEQALAAIAAAVLGAAGGTSPEDALARLETVRVLCAVRHGADGVEGWNRRVEALLARHGHRVQEPWYRGRPVLITANDAQNRLFNGDLGVAWRDDDDRPYLCLAGPGGSIRRIAPQRLPPHETAWAMTVHKAQGSEFDTVLLAMPARAGPLWHASLVYTGITRARQRAVLLADPALLEPGLRTWPLRSSGLAAALQAAPPAAEP